MELISLTLELFRKALITIPFMQLFLLLTISTLFLLFGNARFALLINYLFTFYWGFKLVLKIRVYSAPIIYPFLVCYI